MEAIVQMKHPQGGEKDVDVLRDMVSLGSISHVNLKKDLMARTKLGKSR